MAEALAVRSGLILATTVGCNRIEVNSDGIEVIEIIKNGGHFSVYRQQFLMIYITLHVISRILFLSIILKRLIVLESFYGTSYYLK